MRVCCCSLPYYNPDACRTCSNNTPYRWGRTTYHQPIPDGDVEVIVTKDSVIYKYKKRAQ